MLLLVQVLSGHSHVVGSLQRQHPFEQLHSQGNVCVHILNSIKCRTHTVWGSLVQIGGCVVPLLKQNGSIRSATFSGIEWLVWVVLRYYPRAQRTRLTRTWKSTMMSWLLAIKLLSSTPRLNQLPRQRNTLINIFSSFPDFSTHVTWTAKQKPSIDLLTETHHRFVTREHGRKVSLLFICQDNIRLKIAADV